MQGSLAPRVFTKIAKPLAAHLSEQRVDVLIYLDDWPVTSRSPEATGEMLQTTVMISSLWGFLFTFDKSHKSPISIIHWLAILWDIRCETVVLSSDNILSTQQKRFVATVSKSFIRRK